MPLKLSEGPPRYLGGVSRWMAATWALALAGCAGEKRDVPAPAAAPAAAPAPPPTANPLPPPAPAVALTLGEIHARAVAASKLGGREHRVAVRWIDSLDPNIGSSLAAVRGESLGRGSKKTTTIERSRLLLVSQYPHSREAPDQQHLHRVVVLRRDGRVEATGIRFAKWDGPPDREGLAKVRELLERLAREPRTR